MRIIGTTRKPPASISSIANNIINLVLRNPPLFLPLRQVLLHCKFANDVREIYNTVSPFEIIYPSEARTLRANLVQYYTCSHPVWALDQRRGYILEELVFAIGPEALCAHGVPDYKGYRNAKVLDNRGRPLCGNHNMDIIFFSGASFIAAECKVKLSNWLLRWEDNFQCTTKTKVYKLYTPSINTNMFMFA